MSVSRLLRDEAGATAVLIALVLPVVVGLGAFTVDLSNTYSAKGRLQNAADAAALAAAQELSESVEDARATALKFADMNVGPADGIVATEDDVRFGQYDFHERRFLPGATPYSAVKVATHRLEERGNAVSTFFGGIFGRTSIDVQAEAVAVIIKPTACVFILDPSKSGSFDAGGTSRVEVRHCGIQVDSDASAAMRVGGSASVEAEDICIKGGYSGRNISPTPETGCALQPDPLAGLPEPTPPADCFMKDAKIGTPMVLPSGAKYCGRIEIGAPVTFEPGIVFFEDAVVELKGLGSILGFGVMLYFDGNSTFDFSSKESVVLSAPQFGPYKGIAMFRSRTGKPMKAVLTGGRTMAIAGVIYVPTTDLEMKGTSDIHIMEMSTMVTHTLSLVGTAVVIFDILRGPSPPPFTRPALVH